MNQAGNVYALQSFNYEVTKRLNLRVQASDRGWPQLHNNAVLIINVVDQNDNAPLITQPRSSTDLLRSSFPESTARLYRDPNRSERFRRRFEQSSLTKSTTERFRFCYRPKYRGNIHHRKSLTTSTTYGKS